MPVATLARIRHPYTFQNMGGAMGRKAQGKNAWLYGDYRMLLVTGVHKRVKSDLSDVADLFSVIGNLLSRNGY